MDAELAAELARMAAEDQRIRREAMGSGRKMVQRLDRETAIKHRRIDSETRS